MESAEPDRQPFPEESNLEFVPVHQLQDPVLQRSFAYWDSLRSGRRFPARDLLKPQRLGRALRYLVLLQVIDGGADFEYRIVGDVASTAYRIPRQNCRLSEIAKVAPRAAHRLGRAYSHCLETKAPCGVRWTPGRDVELANFANSEAAILPLGPDDDTVDHILVFLIAD
jgi:hypothetical protein